MKKTHNYIMLLVMAFAVASCADEEIIVNKVVGKPGEEVKFTLSLDKKSRTAYDKETNNTFPIYWVDGDKVQVYSPQALTGRNNAEYKVILPANVEKPNYAEDLVKTGAYGVQWGKGDKYFDEKEVEHTGVHDFYSIYPSGNYTFELTGDEVTGKDMIASGVKISSLQEVNYVDGAFVHDMKNCLMYATTPKVDMEAGVVNLSYNPLSTVLWFELKADAQSTAQTPKNFMITGIQLESAETNIAGTFALNVSDGMFDSWKDGTNKISLTLFDKSGNQDLSYTLPAGKSINFPIFIAPDSELDLSTMKITVNTDQGTYVKTLSKENTNLTLTPGEIHKVVLPTLNITQEGWDVATWMRYIPRNVYLSEISIPGSWNSLNKDAQGSNPSIETQYTNGVRAFHLDTRYKRTGSSGNYKYDVLGTADGGSTTNVSSKKVMTSSSNPAFETNLGKITSNVKSDEYMVLICTFAQDSYVASGNNWIEYISNACDENADVFDAKLLDKNTVVGDVLGKVIVIVNTEGDLTELPEDSKCLFVNMPMTMTAGDFSGVLADRISNIHKADGTDVAESSISMYHTHAQASIRQDNIPYSGDGDRSGTDRGFMPTRGERKREMENILTWSKNNYGEKNYTHDKWIYLGLGGYYVQWNNGLWGIGAKWEEIDNPNTTIAEDFNPWINSKVTDMKGTEEAPYYPIGIVLMNYVNSYKDDAVKNILLLNNKYRLQYDASKPADYNPSGSADSGSGGGGDA